MAKKGNQKPNGTSVPRAENRGEVLPGLSNRGRIGIIRTDHKVENWVFSEEESHAPGRIQPNFAVVAISIACACLDLSHRSRVHIQGNLQDEQGPQAPQAELEKPSRHGRVVGVYSPSTSIEQTEEAKVRSKEAQLEIAQQDQRGTEINLDRMRRPIPRAVPCGLQFNQGLRRAQRSEGDRP